MYGKNGKVKRDLCNKHRTQLMRHGKIFKRTTKDPNEFVINGDIVEIVLLDMESNERARTIIDLKNYDKTKEHHWGLNGDNNYAYTQIDNKKTYLHRLIMNAPNDMVVDHINLNRLDNRESNLRVCTAKENSYNKGLLKNNTSGITGVNFDKKRNKWSARLIINGEYVLRERFNTKEEAILARENAEKKYFGEFRHKVPERRRKEQIG